MSVIALFRERKSCLLFGLLVANHSTSSPLSSSAFTTTTTTSYSRAIQHIPIRSVSSKSRVLDGNTSFSRLYTNQDMTSAPTATDAHHHQHDAHHHGDKQASKTCRHDSPFLESNVSIATALVILNSPIMQSPPSLVFQHLWDFSSFRVAADGGANRLYDFNSSLLPDAIRGDLDSLRPNVRAHYEERGVSVTRDCDQNTNDLDKALQLIHSKRMDDEDDASNSFKRVCVFGAFGGRFDQEMGCIQALFKWSETFDYKLFLFDDTTCAFLLPRVVLNEIRLPFYGETPLNEQENPPNDLVGEGPTCGLIPIGRRCEFVHTTGLKWDLDGCALEFGGTVSTSNRAMKEVITVQASHPLVFSAEMTSGKVTR
jgi:thiamine pyrophosphokinase